MKARPSVAKRQKERARSEKKKFKAEKRAERPAKDERAPRADGEEEEDPDIAGIIPGPQPLDPMIYGSESRRDE